MVYATMSGLSGTFSWRDWAIQKAISVALSILTCGIGKLASIGQTATKVGALSKSAIFLKCIGQSCLGLVLHIYRSQKIWLMSLFE